MATAPWIVSDALWERIAPLLPTVERRVRFPGRRRLPDREALQGILFVLHTGIAWRHLPLELGFGSGSTCYRRLDEWQRAGVWERLHALLLAELRAAGELEWSRAVADSSHVQAKNDRMNEPLRVSCRQFGLSLGLLARAVLTVVVLFELGRRDVAVGFEEAAVVEPVDPFEGRVFELVEAAPGSAVADELGLVEPDDRLGEGVEPDDRLGEGVDAPIVKYWPSARRDRS
jgi:transposase